MPINRRFGRRARWTRRAPGLYRRDTEHAQGFVWVSPKGLRLWSWAVYWHGGSASAVEHSFRRAKRRADEAILAVADAVEGDVRQSEEGS